MARRHERTEARRSALQVLYTSEIQGESAAQVVADGRALVEGELSDYALALIDGVVEHREAIDERLASTSENWTLARMPIVDRSILRLAACEMLYVDDVPISVSINEAVELAKDFGGEDESPRFVNGVLGRIARQLEEEAAAPAPAESEAAASTTESTEPEAAAAGASTQGAAHAE